MVLGLVACGQSRDADSRALSRATPARDVQNSAESSDAIADISAESEQRAPFIELETVGLVLPQHVEPSKQDWDTEVLHEKIAARLKALAKLLEQPEQAGADQLASFASTTFQCGPLRPAHQSRVMDDASFTVFRPDDSRMVQDTSLRGVSGFATALEQLFLPLQDAAGVRVSFKVFRVDSTGSGAESQAFFESRGRTTAGIWQQRAVWKCEWSNEVGSPPLLKSIEIDQFEEALGKSNDHPLFAECTEAVLGSGVAYREQLSRPINHWLERIEHRYGIDPAGWLGLALGDINGDGLDDLYLCEPGGLPNRLFVQHQDGTATDIAAEAGVDWLDHTQAALIVDLDNDAHQDLAVATKAGVVVMSGDGRGRFATKTAKLIPEASPYSLAAADFDLDGDLDIYVCCYSLRAADRRFLQRPVPYHDANNGGRNVLLRNEGNWRFVNATKYVGLDQNNRRFSYAAAWDDYDNDGDLDLYVANDYGRNNLFRNDGGTFTDVAALAGVEDIAAGMSVSWGDYNNDGQMDLYVSNMFSSAGNRIAFKRRFQEGANAQTRAEFQRHARGNSLFQNAGDGTFRDVSQSAAVTMGRWAWGSKFFDLNNDGYEDIAVANGFITQEDPGDL